jgi:NAD(P)H-dependent FMN reductase
MRLLAISGSLRAESSNSRLLRAAQALAPAGVTIDLYDGMGALPHFNPDDDVDVPPPVVAQFRAQIGAADGLLISSPEYAHGVPGSLKNALDWLVSSAEIIDKPIALINASARAAIAHAQLAETLRTMSTNIIAPASITISLDGRKLNVPGLLATPDIVESIRTAIEALVAAIGNSTHR